MRFDEALPATTQMEPLVVIEKRGLLEVMMGFIQEAHRVMAQIPLLQDAVDALGHRIFIRSESSVVLSYTCHVANEAGYFWLLHWMPRSRQWMVANISTTALFYVTTFLMISFIEG